MSGRASSGYVNSIRHTFPAHIPLYVCTIFSLTVITAILAAYDATPRFAAGWAILAIFLIFIGAVTAFAMLREVLLLAREGFSGNAVQSIGVRLAARFHEKDRIGNIFHSVVSLFPLLMGFTVLKGAIAFIHPFAWDMRLSELDAAIGFGTHPWQLLQPFLGYAPITIFLSCVYYLWFPVLFTSLAGQAFSRHGTVLRMQFLIAFTLAFFVSGCILALIFSSAGPCYYAHLHLGGDPYAAQLLYLRSIGPNDLPSVIVQNALWKDFATGSFEEGISAMPSMHVTVAVLIGLLGWRKGGLSGFVLPAFAVLVTLGSVHLAWHYACDSIAGLGTALLFWYAAGRIVEAWNRYLAQYAQAGRIFHQPATLSGTET